jgi:hypothetical protein
MPSFAPAMAVGIAVGLATRALYLARGHRMFPTYPHGLIIHFFLGFVASALGSLAVAALSTANLTAGVFLAIGSAQFHSIRDIERSYMAAVDKDQAVPRGSSYVEGMATAFEARNFLVFTVAAAATAAAHWLGWLPGVVVGGAAGLLLEPLVEGPTLGDICQAATATVAVDGGRLWVGDAEVGAVDAAKADLFRRHGVAVELKAKGFREWQTLRNPGQLQAILHDFTQLVGRYEADDGFWPLVHVDGERRRVLVATVAERALEPADLASVRHFTVVETAYRWRARPSFPRR